MNYRQPVLLLVALSLLISVNYINAWTIPGSNPPSSNVSAPIHTGNAQQTKTGAIGVTELFANDAILNDWLLIRGDEGSATAPSSDTVALELDVNGDVGADRYCDRDGNNCTDATSLGGGGSYQFGGMFTRNADNSCGSNKNYVTGNTSCNCPSGFTPIQILSGLTGGANDRLLYCAPIS